MSSQDKTRARTTPRRLLGSLTRSLLGASLLPLAIGCSSDKGPEGTQTVAGAAGSPTIPGTAGSGGSATPAQGGSGGSAAPATGGSAGTASGGSSPSTAGSGGLPASAGSGGGNSSCTFTCVDQCVEAGGTKKDGTCSGTQVCCDGATTTPANPFAELVPSAKEIGLLLANRFSKQTIKFSSVKDLPGDGYKVACEWYGSMRVAQYTKSQALLDALVTKFDPFKADFVSAMLGGEKHVDRFIFGAVPLEIYLQTSKPEYLTMGVAVAKAQDKGQVRNAIDDMFMMPILQVEAYRALKVAPMPDGGDTPARERLKFMAPIMVDYLKAQKTSDGLFNHNDTQAPIEWGRGNGWFAAGMAEMIKDLPKDFPEYAAIEDGYKKMMAGLLKVQHKDGLWYQVLNQPNDSKNWLETSGSAMFTYAMVTGVRRGILDAATYVPAVKAAWAALKTKVNAQGDVSGICPGTYFHPTAAEYTSLTPITGDGHGQAPVLWTAFEIIR